MAQTVANVSAAKPKIAGAIYVAEPTVTMPTDATTALSTTDWKSLGYVSNEGMTNSNSPNTGNVIAWGGDEVLTLYNEKTDTFQFKLLEVLNVDVLKFVYGDSNVTGTLQTGIHVTANNQMMPTKAFCCDMLMKDGVIKRIVVPNANVTAVGDIVYADSDAIAYDTTVSAKPDSNGATHHEYIAKASNS